MTLSKTDTSNYLRNKGFAFIIIVFLRYIKPLGSEFQSVIHGHAFYSQYKGNVVLAKWDTSLWKCIDEVMDSWNNQWCARICPLCSLQYKFNTFILSSPPPLSILEQNFYYN